MPHCEYRLEGKIALVTGAAARIGAQICRSLHAAGCDVVLHYRRSADRAEALAGELNTRRPDSAFALQADLADMQAIEPLAAAALDLRGRLDILVNNASSYYPTPVGSVTQAQWDDLFASNARAPFFLAQALAPALRAHQGCIVNLVDIHAERPNAHHPVYSMAKAANAMMVKALARDLAPEVRVNGVAPGAALWPEHYFDDQDRLAILERIPLGRPAGAEEIAAAVLFMIAGTDYVTGQILAVDGGRSVQQ
ncbi:MAG: pteridine reductase [Gammaproteobacteria bacterium]|nr:MAG: pteridine reductase [Gammaproteobacteria bacterium]